MQIAEFLLIGTTLTVFLNHTLILSIYLTGIHQKFCPSLVRHHTGAAVEYNDSKLFLQFLHCIGQKAGKYTTPPAALFNEPVSEIVMI